MTRSSQAGQASADSRSRQRLGGAFRPTIRCTPPAQRSVCGHGSPWGALGPANPSGQAQRPVPEQLGEEGRRMGGESRIFGSAMGVPGSAFRVSRRLPGRYAFDLVLGALMRLPGRLRGTRTFLGLGD